MRSLKHTCRFPCLRRAFCAALALVFVLLVPVGCRKKQLTRVSFFAMDTVMDLAVYGSASVLEEAEALVFSLEKEFSVTDPGSEIFALNAAGSAELGADASELIRTALEYCAITDGALDISIYPVVRAWGFTTGEYRVPSSDELAALLSSVDYTKIALDGGRVTLPENAMVDLGAVAKGYTADRIAQLFRSKGVEGAIINLGGNVHTLGTKADGSAWSVAVADPFGEDYACILTVSDRAVVTSGGYQRYFEQDGVTYRHIIDPATGLPVDNGLASVSVVSERGVVADALSTALYVMGCDRAIEFWRKNGGFEAVFITENGELFVTEGLESVCSPAGNYAGSEPGIVHR